MEKQGIIGKIMDEKPTPETQEVVEKVEQKVDSKKEEVVDTVKKETVEETVKDESKKEEVVEKETVEKETVDFVKLFNEKFERDFEKEDDIKALFDKVGGYDELEKSKGELEKQLMDYKKVADGVNPMKYFANEDEFIRNQFLLKNKDKFDDSKLEVLSTLSPDRVSKLSEVDAIKKDLVVNDNVSIADAEEYISETYGDLDDMSGASKVKLQLAAKDARNRLTKLYKGIEIPEQVNVAENMAQYRDSWQKSVDATIEGITKLELDEGVDVEIPTESKEGIADELMSFVVNSGMELTEENLSSMAGRARDMLLARNINDAMKAYAANQIEAEKAKWRADIHNDKPLNTDIRTDTVEKRTHDDIVRNAMLNR